MAPVQMCTRLPCKANLAVECVTQVEEGGGYEVKGRSGGRPRAVKAGSLSTAGPSSPAASWESGAALPHPKRQSPFSSSQQQYSLDTDPAASYGQVHAMLLLCASVLVITWYPMSCLHCWASARLRQLAPRVPSCSRNAVQFVLLRIQRACLKGTAHSVCTPANC